MRGWHTPYLGLRDLLRELSAFELQAFFTFSRAERELIEVRRGDAHKLSLALHIGFPLERYAAQMLPSVPTAKTSAAS